MIDMSNDLFLFKKSNILPNLPAEPPSPHPIPPPASVCSTLVFSWVLVVGLEVLKLLVNLREKKIGENYFQTKFKELG